MKAMGLFDRLLVYRKGQQNTKQKSPTASNIQSKNENAIRVLECGEFIKSLLKADSYIARSDYSSKTNDYASDIEFFFCAKKERDV